MMFIQGSRQAVIAAVVGVAVTLTAFFYLRYTENEQAHEALETEAYSLQRDIRQSLVSHLFVAELLAREWERSDINLSSRRSADADIVTLYYPNVQNVVWLDDSQTIQFLYPRNEQTALVGSVFSGSSLSAQLSQSQNNRHAMMGYAGNLGQLSSDIAIFVRVQRSDTPGFLGFVISLQSMFNNVIRTNISEGFQVSISNDSGVLYEFAGDPSLKDDWTHSRRLQVVGNSWELSVWPTTEHMSDLRGAVSIAVLLAGLFITAALTFVLYILGQSRFKAQQLADANIELYSEIDERERVEKQMAYLAEHDPLTGLINRNALKRILGEWLERTDTRTNSALLFIDLDRFKEVNDALGHTVGDELLRRVARRINKLAPTDSQLARVGGDEFLLAIESTESREQVVTLAERLLQALDAHFFVDVYELFISASIGITFAEDADFNAEYFIRNADTALYQAKEQGRNTYKIYDKAIHKDLTKKLELVKRLRHAVNKQQLTVYYQPKVELSSRRITGFEALVRWVGEDGSIIPPDKFIPLAEDTGLIIPISEYVMRESFLQLKQWHELGFTELSIAINISGKQLHLPDFADDVIEKVNEAKLPPNKVELELTEQVFIENIQSHTRFMHSVREYGMSLAIDDFGVGYSSLSYLKNFPVTSLKIDRSFVKDLPDNEDDATITQTIISLARNLNIQLVAEGIETEEQVEFLLHRECATGQGYLFSKPIPAQQVTQLLQQYNGLIPIQIA
ncbi:bifunctional diguanylate cyclase/phosphodiesterase [Idiomarina piscisalsi]|uniref:putative bifunctional diguanylate cyclase/phosphodiesterase n=1 Tax=Idiomarina piscisalsi TaxID=1096243 RepID=UPI00137FB4AE|nr:EAL domain-containing protein [Idiomarina piscisalsi]MTJ02069.1 EAL domain-containing protein [Idiomarina piscisalsi]